MPPTFPKLKPRYLTNEKGRVSAVVLDQHEFQKLLDYIEDLEDILACYQRKDEPSIPWEEAMRRLKKPRRKKAPPAHKPRPSS